MTRPLIYRGVHELEEYADENWHSLYDLPTALEELSHRKQTARIRRLVIKATDRIEQLKHAKLQELLSSQLEYAVFRDWTSNSADLGELPQTVVAQGCDPLALAELSTLLALFGIQLAGELSADVETLIVGQEDWGEDYIRQQIDLRSGKTCRVYSQEMFFAFLATNKDPLQGSRDLLQFFAEDHPGLEFLIAIGFKWPSTDAPLGSGEMESPDSPDTGVLKAMGYTVGRNGKRDGERHRILGRAFKIERLPRVGGTSHMSEWGASSSEARLSKMAEALAAFARNAKRRKGASMSEAIADWESDLAWLKRMYYRGSFSFRWPDTDSS